ncbi:hypothetical protein KIN20_030266 [Parelaphostrongylus tenuis]|uniref:Uncharacterized protein n=1 Tax=Parelaphostrongylus tenuis TaxID=148309 RepID=A0AAD5R3G7_PARTN|nr:hypothetical protein KIN20_030266 [Parelaphostrongylus tenuis]
MHYDGSLFRSEEWKMKILSNTARLPTNPLTISLLAAISTALGCGVMPPGQGVCLLLWFILRSLTFLAQVPGIANSEAAAKGFVERLVMQTVFDVLELQARSALLPEALISSILGQLSARISYTPMNCPMVISPGRKLTNADEDKEYCIIVSSTVTGICKTMKGVNDKMCSTPEKNVVETTPVADTLLTISGTLMTTNIVMASWSRAMWQNVLNRAIRILAFGPFGSHFLSASADVGRN